MELRPAIYNTMTDWNEIAYAYEINMLSIVYSSYRRVIDSEHVQIHHYVIDIIPPYSVLGLMYTSVGFNTIL